ncbi:MAG TPA: hypothetical protein VKU01_09095 [Bryobacteraceae bacterium]|nr:hypothetical protein [Bryobacteraceae bacterium]
MKTSLAAVSVALPTVAALVVLINPLHAQTAAALAHNESSFDLAFKAPYSVVAPLFGAEGERLWAGAEWNPQFAFPSPGKDVMGAVFAIENSGHKSYWMTAVYDLSARHIQYIYITPSAMMNKIDITFPETGPDLTKVHVAYTRTALQQEINPQVEHAAAQDSLRAHEWQQAIDKYLAAARKR